MDKGVGLVMKFRVRIPQKSVVVLGRVTNLKMLMCYIRKPCSVASIALSHRNRKKRFGSLPEQNAKVKKIVEFYKNNI